MDPNQQKYGLRRFCFVCMGFFGFFLLAPGVSLTAVGNSDSGHDDFFEPSHRPMRIIGPILLCVGIVLLVVSIIGCVVTYRMIRSEQSEWMASQPSRAGPVVSGYTPSQYSGNTQYSGGTQYSQNYPQPGAVPYASGYTHPAGHEMAATIPLNPQPTAPPSNNAEELPPSYESIVNKKESL